MSVHEAAIDFIERAGLTFHQGSAVVAIVDGNVGRAIFHLQRAAGTATALPAPAPVAVPEDIPQLRVSQGIAPARRGESRRCKKCGESKGVTAFMRGEDVCRTCAKRSSPFVHNVTKPAVEEPDARRQAYWRECKECGAKKGLRSFAAGEDTCKACKGDDNG